MGASELSAIVASVCCCSRWVMTSRLALKWIGEGS